MTPHNLWWLSSILFSMVTSDWLDNSQSHLWPSGCTDCSTDTVDTLPSPLPPIPTTFPAVSSSAWTLRLVSAYLSSQPHALLGPRPSCLLLLFFLVTVFWMVCSSAGPHTAHPQKVQVKFLLFSRPCLILLHHSTSSASDHKPEALYSSFCGESPALCGTCSMSYTALTCFLSPIRLPKAGK